MICVIVGEMGREMINFYTSEGVYDLVLD